MSQSEYRSFDIEITPTEHPSMGSGFAVSVSKNDTVYGSSGFGGVNEKLAQATGQAIVDRIHEWPTVP